MKKPVYYIYIAPNQTKEDVQQKIDLFYNAGFQVVLITDTAKGNIKDSINNIIEEYLHRNAAMI